MSISAPTNKALRNVTWLFGEKCLTMGLSLAVSIMLARNLGVSDFGKLNYLLSYIALLVPFSSLGLNSLVVRELVNRDRELGLILGVALSLRWIGGGAVILIIFLITLIFPPSLLISNNWVILGAIGSSFIALQVFDSYFQSLVKSKYVVVTRSIVLIVSSSINLLAVILELSLDYFLAIAVMNPILTGLGLYTFYRRESKCSIKLKFEVKYAINLISQSKWLIFSGFMAIVYLKIDQIMIGDILGSDELGVYSVAVRLSEVWYFFPTAIVVSFFPKLLKSKNDNQLYMENLQKLCDCLFWLGITVAIFVGLVSNFAVTYLYGEDYSMASDVLNVHVWAGVFIFIRALLSKWLISEGLLKFSLFTHGIAAVINVVLNYIWIPQYGIVGAAFATLISYATSSYFVLWLFKSTRPMAIIMSRSVYFPLRAIKKFHEKCN